MIPTLNLKRTAQGLDFKLFEFYECGGGGGGGGGGKNYMYL